MSKQKKDQMKGKPKATSGDKRAPKGAAAVLPSEVPTAKSKGQADEPSTKTPAAKPKGKPKK